MRHAPCPEAPYSRRNEAASLSLPVNGKVSEMGDKVGSTGTAVRPSWAKRGVSRKSIIEIAA